MLISLLATFAVALVLSFSLWVAFRLILSTILAVTFVLSFAFWVAFPATKGRISFVTGSFLVKIENTKLLIIENQTANASKCN